MACISVSSLSNLAACPRVNYVGQVRQGSNLSACGARCLFFKAATAARVVWARQRGSSAVHTSMSSGRHWGTPQHLHRLHSCLGGTLQTCQTRVHRHSGLLSQGLAEVRMAGKQPVQSLS